MTGGSDKSSGARAMSAAATRPAKCACLKMLRHVRFYEGEVQSVDLAERRAVVAHGFDRHTHSLEYDRTNFEESEH